MYFKLHFAYLSLHQYPGAVIVHKEIFMQPA